MCAARAGKARQLSPSAEIFSPRRWMFRRASAIRACAPATPTSPQTDTPTDGNRARPGSCSSARAKEQVEGDDEAAVRSVAQGQVRALCVPPSAPGFRAPRSRRPQPGLLPAPPS